MESDVFGLFNTKHIHRNAQSCIRTSSPAFRQWCDKPATSEPDSTVWPYHRSSIWPWSGVRKIGMYGTVYNRLTSAGNAEHTNKLFISPSLTVADTSTTFFFLTKSAPYQNKCITTHPISLTLPNRKQFMSTHLCNVVIPGLCTVLTGHIVLDLTIASLFRICLLCKAGCTVIFHNDKCQIVYNNKVILTGYKEPLSNVWTLLILPEMSKSAPVFSCTVYNLASFGLFPAAPIDCNILV